MLDFKEVKELEKRYEEYIALKLDTKPSKISFEFSRNLKYIIFGLLFIVALICLFVFFQKSSSVDSKNVNVETKKVDDLANIDDVKAKTQEAKNKYEAEKVQNEIADKIVKKIEEKISIPEINSTTQTEQKPQNQKYVQQGWLRLNHIEPSGDLPVRQDKRVPSEIPVPDTQQINFQPEKSQNPKPSIQIQVVDEKPKDLEEELVLKFKNTRDIRYALELSAINLNRKDYHEAIKWALNANEIDSDSEESWILFAKAKYMLNQKNDALRVLRAYNKNKNSKNIEVLIKKIESNVL